MFGELRMMVGLLGCALLSPTYRPGSYVIPDPDRGSSVSVSECFCFSHPTSDARLLTSKPGIRRLVEQNDYSVSRLCHFDVLESRLYII